MRSTLLIFFLLLCSIFHFPLYAQQVGHTTYSLKEGLPQSEVFTNCFLQDKNGVLWAGTNGGGVTRKEGNNFKIFDTQHGTIGNVSRALTEGEDGIVWVYFANKGITGFTKDGIKNYTLPILNSAKIGGGAVLTDSLGGLIFLSRTATQNIFIYKKVNEDSLQDLSQEVNFENPNEAFRSVRNFQGKGVLLTTNLNVYKLQTSTQKFTPFTLSGYVPGESTPLVFINEDQKGRLWFREAGAPNKLVFWETPDSERKEFVFPRNFLGAITRVVYDAQNDATLFLERMNSIWRYTQTEGLREITSKNGLPVKTYQDLLLDEENNIWIATSGGGLLKLAPLYFENYTTEEGLPENIIFGIHRRPDSTLFFSTSTEGLAYQANGQIMTMNSGLNIRRPACYHEHEDGSLLIGSYFPGVLKWQNNTLLNVNATYNIPNGTAITAIYENDSTLFFGSINAGIYVYDKSLETTSLINTTKGLGNDAIRSIVPDSKGNLWIAHTTGIAKVLPTIDTAYTYAIDPNKQMSIQLDVDAQDRVWVATFGSGLLMVEDGKTQAIFNAKNGLASDIVYSVLCGKEGSIWVGTQKGIDRLWVNSDGEITKKQHFDRSTGFLGQELNGNAISQEANGDMWFGHLHGAARLRVSELPKEQTYVPKTHINAINFYLDQTNWSDSINAKFHSGLKGEFQLPENLTLPYNRNNLVFNFFSSSQQPENKIDFQWQLVGQDNNWLPVTSRHEATYSNLAPGTYTFQVRSRIKGGKWGEEKAFTFTVNPPFWQHPAFILLAVISFFALLYAGYRGRIRAIKLRQQELEILVEERTKEVVQQKDEILEKNVELEQQKEEILAQNEEIEQTNKALEGANHEIRQQNDNITASINYARRIQYAMLPSERQIQEGFKDSFLLFKPRDVVSGDFAWYTSVEKNSQKHYVIAAVDCTGHGVPGAFMSFLGEGYLNQIVNLEKELDPSVVLFKLDYHITRALEQDHNTVQSADGMDIALCTYIPAENRLCFAGAKNPLIYFQNEEMYYIKGSRSPIGGKSVLKAIPEFYSYEININTATTVYIYSDGFQDQFGGEKGKKYMSKHFRRYLGKISNTPLKEQKDKLANELQQWKGELPQVDDILVIGFRLTPTD